MDKLVLSILKCARLWKVRKSNRIKYERHVYRVGVGKRDRGAGWERSYKRAEYSRMSKCEGSSLLHFKPKRGHSSGFRRADVLYYCSVEIAILRLHSGPRACIHRTQASLFRHSQDNALVPYIRFSHAQAIHILNQSQARVN